MMALVILGREIQKKNQGHGPNPLSKDTIPHYQRITRVQAHAGNDSVNGLIRRARNLILSIYHYSLNDDSIQKSGRTGEKVVAKSVPVNEKVLVTNGVDSSHLHCTGTLVERDIRIEDVLDLGEKFNDVLFVSRNTASLVERCTVNTTDILVLGERIHDSLVVCE